MSRLFAASLAACFAACTLPALAAISGFVRGQVTFNGAPASGAAVILSGEGSRFDTKTNAAGAYSFANVPFGHYRLLVTYTGAADRTYALNVASDSVATVNVPLSTIKEIAVSSVDAHQTVSGTPVSSDTITKSQILASPNRDSLNKLIETVPGIVSFSYNEPIAHGFHGVSYELDGAPLPLATSSNFGEIIDPKSIDSLEVLTGAFPAEYGGSRMGALVNIVSTRLSDQPLGYHGSISAGAGNYASSLLSMNELARFKNSEVYLSLNGQRTNRGIDAPTYNAIHDRSSLSDQFLRYVLQPNERTMISFDFSNQLNQFQIPINTDPNNPIDPIFSPPGTNDVQREYDRFFTMNFTSTSKDGNGVFQVIPWLRSTRIAYNGDLFNDVNSYGPNPSTVPGAPALANQVGLNQDRRANYVGLRVSDFRAGKRHAWKVGIDASREVFNAAQTFACYTADCNSAPSTPPPPPPAPGYYTISSAQSQPGTLVGIYAQDTWQPNRNLSFSYGLRYDHSTGYVGGSMLEPRIGMNVSDGKKNVFHVYYGRMYAAPQLEDVRQDCVLLNGCTGSPVYDLQPERDAYWEMGVAHTFGGNLTGYADIFQRSVTNVLDTTQFLNTPLFAVYNNATGIDSGVELRLQDRLNDGDAWFLTTTVSGSYAGGISGSTFLFPTDALNTGGLPIASPALLSPEDHDQTVAATASYTHRFGFQRQNFATLEADYGTGYPVAFQNVSGAQYSGRLASHTTLDLALGRQPKTGVGFALDVTNLLNHQYILKIANGFNTTQIAQGRQIVFRVTAPF